MALSKTTQNHDTIRNWAEKRGAMPAEVAATHKGKQTGILRFAFPKAKGHKDENLQEISWDDFFEKFDQNGLELIYQEKTAGGAQSNFNKLIYPEDEHASGRSSRSSGHSSRSGSARSSHSESSASSSRSASAKTNSASPRRTMASSRSTSASKTAGRTSSSASRKKAA